MKKTMSFSKKENLKRLIGLDFERLIARVNMITADMSAEESERFKKEVFGDMIMKIGSEMKYS